jgi:exopolysaccharide biosynthesis polyprenyl glycosylphosphotransferase
MLRQFSTGRIVGFLLFDWLATLGALWWAAQIRVWIGVLPANYVGFAEGIGISVNTWPIETVEKIVITPLSFLVAALWPIFFFLFGVYDGRRNRTLRSELLNTLMAIVAATLVLAGVLYFTYQEVSRIAFLMFFLIDSGILLGMRFFWWIFRSRSRSVSGLHRTLIVGAGPVGIRVADELRRYSAGRILLTGFVDDDPVKHQQILVGLPVLGTLDQLPGLVNDNGLTDAVVALPLQAHARLVEVCSALQEAGVHVHVVPDLFTLSFPSASLDGFGGIPVLDLGQPGIHGWRRIFKRLFDILVTLLVLLFIWPLMFAVALAIKLDSPGPVFYLQKRIGENGHPFKMFKFRSMHVNNDESIHREYVKQLIQENISLAEGSTLKLMYDPRITRVGHFIRKTSLDELPQLFNVLRGEMSLVGPRPPIPYEVEVYQKWHLRRLEAIPGITGLWQVHGRNRVSFDEMVRMDMDYIERQSIWLDIQLLIKTPSALVSGRGAG